VGLSVTLIGVSGAMAGMLQTTGSGPGLTRVNIMILVVSLILGGLCGEAIDFEKWFNRAGRRLSALLPKGAGDDASGGFASATILFCVGAMAVIGAMEEALLGDPSTILAKGVLDGVMSAVLASTMGIGVAFSAVSVFVYQTAISLLAGFLSPVVTDGVLTQMSLVGSSLIMGIGLNLLGVTHIKIGNLLPATFIPILWGVLTKFI
jgi:uncharacterized membrane protein YqgA involved in biofilm formation